MTNKHKSFVVIGAGRFGSAVAMTLFEKGHQVLVIDKQSHRISHLASHVTEAVIADARDETVLEELDVRSFDAAIVAIATDVESSALVSVMLKDMGVPHLTCKAKSETHAKLLQYLGVDKIVRPEHEMGVALGTDLSQLEL